MCVSPRVFRPLFTYPNSFLNCSSVTTGCGKCEECREIKRNEWVNRFCFEYDSNKSGKCLFLTFTYNNEHLPRYTDGSFSCLCFKHSDVLTFLGSLEDYYMYRYHRKPYKYFFASEYGKNTQRPHYHAVFWLDSSIADDWRTFVEVCREIWSRPLDSDRPFTSKSSLNFGWMFPIAKCITRSSDNKVLSCLYVDSKGKDRTPLIRAGVKGMVYCSKYATKDMSFYSPAISDYLSSERGFALKPFLPKHWQSKKLGYSAVTLAASDIESSIKDGILNPLTLSRVPLPNYVVNKLLYVNVFRGRVNSLGKKLYDRELSSFGKKYLVSVFKNRVNRTAVKMSSLFQINDYSSLLSKCGIMDVTSSESFIPVSLYHHFYKNFDSNLYELVYRSVGSVSDMLSLNPLVCGFYLHTKDTSFKRDNVFTSHALLNRDLSFFGFIPDLDSVYCSLSRQKQSLNLQSRISKRVQSYETSEKFTHGFPINLC